MTTNIFKVCAAINGCTFAGLDTRTDVKLRGGQANPHQGRITKITKGVRGLLLTSSASYHNMVKRRLVDEGISIADYEPNAPQWGERIDEDMPVYLHKGQKYLQVICTGAGTPAYYCDGKPLTVVPTGQFYDDDDYLVTGFPEPPKDANQHGLTNKVKVRRYKLKSILELRTNGDIYHELR